MADATNREPSAAVATPLDAWPLVLAASELARRFDAATPPHAYAASSDGQLSRVAVSASSNAVLNWRQETGWEPLLPDDDPRRPLLDLYLPLCSATRQTMFAVGHLGQSLDGFIATPSGDSQFVTGRENILHLHRMRALCDAVVVGAGTVAADDPQLTTRHVDGPNATRVVFDPGRRLADSYRIFDDEAAPTLYACAASLIAPGETHVRRAEIVSLRNTSDAAADVLELSEALQARGCRRIFVEGGGVTVSAFLAASLLDRLHLAIAPLFIGEGRPAIRLPAQAALSDCLRPSYRVFRMGGDILFDCDLSGRPRAEHSGNPDLQRII